MRAISESSPSFSSYLHLLPTFLRRHVPWTSYIPTHDLARHNSSTTRRIAHDARTSLPRTRCTTRSLSSSPRFKAATSRNETMYHVEKRDAPGSKAVFMHVMVGSSITTLGGGPTI
ncbi:hypothetical protein PM082_017612 [Marasmius tenuissimus]|nr:hypothetical protein PM082_017612 [Marasmius tenuissimus]